MNKIDAFTLMLGLMGLGLIAEISGVTGNAEMLTAITACVGGFGALGIMAHLLISNWRKS